MVIIVMGDSRSDRNQLARIIAITLDWEFADALSLPGAGASHVHESPVTRGEATRAAQMQALVVAVQNWNYKWQDVIVSCWVLTEHERKIISNPGIDFVLMNSAEYTIQPAAPSQLPPATDSISTWTTAQPHSNRLLVVNPSRRTKEIVGDVISALVLNRRLPNVVTC